MRGGILGGALVVEREISAAVGLYILGQRADDPAMSEVFDDIWGALSFERRINAALALAPHFLELEEVAGLRNDPSELRIMRNAMAQKPFLHEPQVDRQGRLVDFMPMVMKGKAPLPLTSASVGDLNALIQKLIEQTRALKVQVEHNRQPVRSSLASSATMGYHNGLSS